MILSVGGDDDDDDDVSASTIDSVVPSHHKHP